MVAGCRGVLLIEGKPGMIGYVVILGVTDANYLGVLLLIDIEF